MSTPDAGTTPSWSCSGTCPSPFSSHAPCRQRALPPALAPGVARRFDRIEEESEEVLEKPDGPLDELEKLWPEDEVDGNLFGLGRRLFYDRGQQILDIMHPGREFWVGFDLIWQYCESDIPGAAVSNALCDGENINGHCLSVIEATEAH